MLDDYYLNKDDWDAIVELGVGEDYAQEGVLKKIPSSVKSAFTRAYAFFPFFFESYPRQTPLMSFQLLSDITRVIILLRSTVKEGKSQRSELVEEVETCRISKDLWFVLSVFFVLS